MPSRNTIRQDSEHSYYHVYARGASKQAIFIEPADYHFFISLFKRYLSKKPTPRKQGGPYPNLHSDIRLIAYCLMQNHFHLYVYQIESGGLSQLMHGVMTSYSRYFNNKYGRTGSVLESRYKAALITTDQHNTHISRYIHMNPRYWQRYPYSSLGYYLGQQHADWISADLGLQDFNTPASYLNFLKEYQDNKSQLEEIKPYLANY